jgi:predicted XRE-type DNA-binding protein
MDGNQNEIVLYQKDKAIELEVRLENETVWLTQSQIAKLFGVQQPAISKHLKNIFSSGELQETAVYSILEYTAADGKDYKTGFDNLDAILSVGYRVNSQNATQFRIWASGILRDYLLRGYAVSQRIDRIERKLKEHEGKFDLMLKTALPPKEGIFYDGKIFDAYVFASELIKSAKKTIVLIDNYVDESVLLLLSKRKPEVSATIHTVAGSVFALDLKKHNLQYPPVTVHPFNRSHDRFLIIDGVVYHIGASLKDLGKKWFAFSRMETGSDRILGEL